MPPPPKKSARPRVKAPSSRNAPRRKKKTNAAARSFVIVFVLLTFIAVTYQFFSGNWRSPFAYVDQGATVPAPAAGEIRVYFLDVGQGDSILLQTADNAVLIDAGEYSARRALLSYLRDAGVTVLDYVIATHPHEDHIGGMIPVLENFTVNRMAMTSAAANTDAYETFLEEIDAKGVPVTIPRPGDVIEAGLIRLDVLAPLSDYSNDLNNASLVLRMVHGDNAFLFTGDAEHESEQDMLNANSPVQASVIKIGHHGSSTATSPAFLDAVRPAAAVISCGSVNSYGHPHDETIALLEERGIQIYRTDEDGTIIMSTDGTQVKLW